MIGLDRLPATPRAILQALKALGPRTAAELAKGLGTSAEAARQHLRRLELDGFVSLDRDTVGPHGGRPAHRFGLTTAGEDLFPKRYDDLAVILLDAVGERLGSDALAEVLVSVVDAKVAAWAPQLEGLNTDQERLEALKSLYVQDDPWVEVQSGAQGAVLIERNCPFHDVAMRRPALCAVTVNTLSRLLGRRVERVRTFQSGHGNCTFRVTDEPFPAASPFQFERRGKGSGSPR